MSPSPTGPEGILKDDPVIHVEGQTKYYGDFLAIDLINFQVNQGEMS
jgi:ABC-type Fe3+/spermidine/putrescine transport system ATPase subunit